MTRQGDIYQICIQGHVNSNWTEWLQAFQIRHKKNGITILTGKLTDQSALQGLLDHLFDMGITILSMKRVSKKHKFLSFFQSTFN